MTQLDEQLGKLGPQLRAGGPSGELKRLVESSPGVQPRRPRRQLGWFVLVCSALAVSTVSLLGLRPDVTGLGVPYLGLLATAWTIAVGLAGFLALTPRRGSALPRGRVIGGISAVTGATFIAIGLLWTESVPGVSHGYEPGLGNIIRWAPYCLIVGTGSSLVPLALGALLLRRALPVGSAWVGAGVGAAGGCIGGLILHFHCSIAEATHFGLVHGGVVLIAAGLGAALFPRVTRL